MHCLMYIQLQSADNDLCDKLIYLLISCEHSRHCVIDY
jgi:hypothetical protein